MWHSYSEDYAKMIIIICQIYFLKKLHQVTQEVGKGSTYHVKFETGNCAHLRYECQDELSTKKQRIFNKRDDTFLYEYSYVLRVSKLAHPASIEPSSRQLCIKNACSTHGNIMIICFLHHLIVLYIL